MKTRKRIGAWVWIFPILSLLALAHLFMVEIDVAYYEKYGYGLPSATIRSGLIGLYLIFIVIIAVKYMTSTVKEEESAATVKAVESAEPVPREKKVVVEEITEKTVEYPPKISGAIYGDAYIDVGENTKLLVRTVLARLCVLCDEQVKCWDKVRDRVAWEDFIANTECKGGLRKLIMKAADR